MAKFELVEPDDAKFTLSEGEDHSFPGVSFGNEKKPAGTRKDVMGIASPRSRAEGQKLKQNTNLKTAGRFGLQAGGAVAGGILASPGGPLTSAAGGATGYAIGNKLADMWYQDRPSTPANVSNSPVVNALAGETLQSAGDIAVGGLYEAGGYGMNLAGRGMGNLVDMRKAVKASGGVKPVVQNFLAKRAEKAAANKILQAKTTSPGAQEQIGKNALANEQVEQGLPGFKFNTAQKGGDPNLLSMARQTGQQPGVGTALSNESTMAQNAALRENIQRDIKGEGNADDWLMSLQKEQQRLEAETLAEARAAEATANNLQGVDAQTAGGALLDKATAARRASSAKGKALFDQVPKDLQVETGPLYDKIKELFGSFNELTQRLSATPTGIMSRMKRALEPEEAGAGQLFDYEGMMKQFGQQTGVRHGKTGKGFFTESDFQNYLKQYFPSVAGKPKSEIMNALRDGINGKKITPFRQGILDDIAADLEAQGAQIGGKAQGATGPQPLTFKDMQDFRSQVKTAARQAYASGDRDLGRQLDELATATSESFEQTAAQGGGGATGAIPQVTAAEAQAAKQEVVKQLATEKDPTRQAQLQVQLDNYNKIIEGKADYKSLQAPEHAESIKQINEILNNPAMLQEYAGMYKMTPEAATKQLQEELGKYTGGGSNQAVREGLDKLKAATKYWREVHVPSFRQGATGKILANTNTGEQKIIDSAIGSQYFKPGRGRGAAEGFDSFTLTFGKDPGAKQLIKDYAAQDLLQSARNPVTGEIESKRVAAWLYQHGEALEKFGMKDDFGSLTKALAKADKARGAEATFNKSALEKALNVDPDKAIAQALMTGTGRKQSIQRLKQLSDIAMRSDNPKAAMEGLRAAIGDYFERETTVTARDLAQNKLESLAKVDRFMKDFLPALKQSGVYSPKQLATFENVHKALQGIARQQTPHPGFQGSATAELLSRLAASGTSMAFGHIGLYGAAKGVFNMLERPIKQEIEEATARALYDPRYAEAIVNLANNAKAKMPVSQIEKIFRQRIQALGGLAMGKAAGATVSARPAPAENPETPEIPELVEPETVEPRKTYGGTND